MTHDEYAAIGRRVAAMRHHALGNGGCLSDRAALWEKLQEVKAVMRSIETWWLERGMQKFDGAPAEMFDLRALLESLGGTDGKA